MKRNLKLEAFYPYPPERIWQAFFGRMFEEDATESGPGSEPDADPHPPPPVDPLDSKALKQWLTENAGDEEVKVHEVDAPRLISATGRIDQSLKPTTITVTLAPEAGGTRLTLQHTGFQGLRAIAFSFLIALVWRWGLRKKFPAFLRETLEPQP